MFFGFSQKDGNFDTIVANEVLIGDKDNPMIKITKDSDGGMIFIHDQRGIRGISLMTIDNHGLISIDTHCGDLDPSCVSGQIDLSADEYGGLIDIYAKGTIQTHTIGVSEVGGMMELYDIKSREVVNSLGTNGNGGFVSTSNNLGNMTGYIGTDDERDGVWGVFDKNGNEYK